MADALADESCQEDVRGQKRSADQLLPVHMTLRRLELLHLLAQINACVPVAAGVCAARRGWVRGKLAGCCRLQEALVEADRLRAADALLRRYVGHAAGDSSALAAARQHARGAGPS